MSAAVGTSASNRRTRRNHRYSLAVPIDVTVLRSGVPDSIPGRAVNVCESGLGAVVAGELHSGDSVGVEFRLPSTASPFQAKAIVRYEARLQCGLEFQGLSAQQRDAIRYWALRTDDQAHGEHTLPEHSASAPAKVSRRKMASPSRRVLWMALAAFSLVCGLGLWQWYSAWNDLEAAVPGKQYLAGKEIPKVPASQMEQLVTHRVDPVYPDAARQSKLQGVVLIDMLVGPDGTVLDLHPVSGPAELTAAAADAVRWWRFQPYRVNGQAVAVETTVAVDFHP
ncbi:MAG TPA: TonB family protein [Terriglobales bacterium]|nr:TonB family protein [Terriglobales bacterium]